MVVMVTSYGAEVDQFAGDSFLLLPHSCNILNDEKHKNSIALFFFLLLKHFMKVFWFFWKVGGKEDVIRGDGNNKETKRVEQVILKLMRK